MGLMMNQKAVIEDSEVEVEEEETEVSEIVDEVEAEDDGKCVLVDMKGSEDVYEEV